MALAAVGRPVRRDADAPEDEEARRHRKFHSSPLYKRKAAAAFRLFGMPVYIVPVYRRGLAYGGRGAYVGWEEAAPLLDRSGLDADAVRRDVEGGGTVILAASKQMVEGFLPTPWMLLHALFDDLATSAAESRSLLRATVSPVYDRIVDVSLEGPWGRDDFMRALVGSMTMRSAREGKLNIDTIDDIASELCIQAAVSSRGCVIKEFEGDEEIDGALRGLQDFVNGLDVRGALEGYLRGRVVQVQGENFDYLSNR